MQPAVILQAEDFAELVRRLANLEAAEQARILAHATPPYEVLATAKAAAYIGLSVDALLRARSKGRIQGVRLNEKDWGFSTSALNKYPRRGHRTTS